MPDWITLKEAAELSGYDIQHVRRLAWQGKIGAEKKAAIGGSTAKRSLLTLKR